MTLRRSVSTGLTSPPWSGANFCSVVKMIPPEARLRSVRRSARESAWTGRLGQDLGRGEDLAEELVVEVVAVGQEDQRRVVHARVAHDLGRVEQHLDATCRCPGCARQHHRDGRRPGPTASTVDSTAALTAQYWWYLATRLTKPSGSSLKTVKFRTMSRNRRLIEDAPHQHLERRQARDNLSAVDRLPRRVVLEAARERTHRAQSARPR